MMDILPVELNFSSKTPKAVFDACFGARSQAVAGATFVLPKTAF
jgi:hypothetical protein